MIMSGRDARGPMKTTSPTIRAAPPVDRDTRACRYRSPTGRRGRRTRRRPPTRSPSIATTGSISEAESHRSSPPDPPACTSRRASSSRVRRIPGFAGTPFPWRPWPSIPTRPAHRHSRSPEAIRPEAIHLAPEPPAPRARPGAAVLSRLLREEQARVVDVGPVLVGVAGDGDDLSVILPGLGRIAGFLGGSCCTDIGVEPVGLLFQRRFESGEGLLGHAALEQHAGVELARGLGHARRHGVLLGLVLGIGGGTHGFQRVVALAFGVEDPGGCDLLLDIDLLGPVGVLGLAELVLQFG